MTPEHVLAMPWRLAIGLLVRSRSRSATTSRPSDGPVFQPIAGARKMSKAGFEHAPGYSKLLAMFGG